MATAHPKLALRPFLPEDAGLLAEIFRESVTELTGEPSSVTMSVSAVPTIAPRMPASSGSRLSPDVKKRQLKDRST